MNESELIARQALCIAELEDKIKQYVNAEDNIYKIIYCIGGPLNDNKLKYTHAQMGNFAHIANELVDY